MQLFDEKTTVIEENFNLYSLTQIQNQTILLMH